MSWDSLSIDDLKTRFSAAEYDAISEAALASDQDATTVAESVIADVVQYVRGKVAACAANVLGEGATIPGELRDAALSIARQRVLSRIGGLESLHGELRASEVKQAEALLNAVARCEFRIEQPATPSGQTLASPTIGIINSRDRITGRSNLGGLS